MTYRSDLIELQLYFHMETEKAVMFSEDGKKTFFLPKSQIEYCETNKTNIYDVTIPEWLATEKGLV